MKARILNTIKAALVITLPMAAFGQDYHFSQFDAMVPAYQPAKTGMFNDSKYRATTQYRNQWRPIATKPFTTFGMSYDMPINERWGVGGYIQNFDGARVFNAFNVVASGAYKITDPTQNKHLLTTGLQLGGVYKNINNLDLLFENQYDDGKLNPVIASNESFRRMSKLSPEVNLGVYYEWTDEVNDYHPYIGFTAFHLTSPKESILETGTSDARLPRRWLFHSGCKLDLTEEIDMDFKAMYQYQGKATELMLGFSGIYKLHEAKTDIHLGCYYRNRDAVIINTGLTYEELTFTIGYDITVSGLKEYNGGYGALEFGLTYRPGL
ncbi:MAG: type IX secretion system PorP/SprF family membrane protein [Flavobacteriales bacterium]|jgi:type IX secretion system PorP/SprF family membrane protein